MQQQQSQPQPRTKTSICTWVTLEQKSEIEILADKFDTSVSELLRTFLEAGLRENPLTKRDREKFEEKTDGAPPLRVDGLKLTRKNSRT